ncbi:MAG: DUF3598 family protein [Cyanobacteria bacterium J06581_3]
MTSQWDSLRKNIGVWKGAFVQFSPKGAQVSETPSVLTLEESAPGKTINLTLERFPPEAPKKVNNLTFTASGPGPALSFFENGTFAQGSSQWSAFGQFATEVSLKIGDNKRVRYVVMYESTQHYTSQIKYVTLICEHREGTAPFTEKPLTTSQISSQSDGQSDGSWTGEASVVFTDGKPPTTGRSQWQLDSNLAFSCAEQWADSTHSLEAEGLGADKSDGSAAQPATVIRLAPATEGQLPYQLMLLPKGAYCLLPTEIEKERDFRLEVGWLSDAGERSSSGGVSRTRLIRYYDTRGVHTESALIKDQRSL